MPSETFILKSTPPAGSETSLNLKLENIPSFSAGSKMFLNPRIYRIYSSSLPLEETRRQDFYFNSTFHKIDTTVYNLPKGFTLESLPIDKSLKFEYGLFKTRYLFDDKQKTVTTYATLTLSQNKIPAEKYQEARNFFNAVLDEYNDKIVIRKD